MGNLTPSTYEQALTYLTINSSFTGDLGLFHGRMGIILFFAHYARATQSKHYEDFAGYLLDELYEEIHEDLPVNLENGLCGIGWGIEYLVQQGFMEGDTDEILADIDRKVMELDPLRMTNLSFRRGLAGIAFYVIVRLNAHREASLLPFDAAYLTSLQQALERTEFTEAEEIPVDLSVIFNQVLKGGKLTLSLPDCLTHSELSLDKPFDEILLGLEEGLAGWLWSNLSPAAVRTDWLPKADKCIFLFDEESRSTKYGIGTYVNQLTDALQNTEWQVVRVRVFVETKEALTVWQDEKAVYIHVGGFKSRNYQANDAMKRYYRNLFFVLYPYLKSANAPLFHLNAMHSEALADRLKHGFPESSVRMTVHYTNWSFDLLGDREKLQAILASPKDEKEQAVAKGFEGEKRLMHLCDRIIAIARHSYEDIVSLYQVPPEKVSLIPHGLADAYQSLSEEERNKRRKKYGFSPDDQLLVFAGRIDPVKGVEYLAQAFASLSEQYPKLRLIIAGDGNFQTVFTALKPGWSKVTCTGFVDKPTLYELFSISDIGILPSLHEEFGFVALEMMMMKLPLIVGNTTGLAELISQKENGLVVHLKNSKDNNNPNEICEAVQTLLNDKLLRLRYAEAARKKFLACYTVDLFRKRMLDFYNSSLK